MELSMVKPMEMSIIDEASELAAAFRCADQIGELELLRGRLERLEGDLAALRAEPPGGCGAPRSDAELRERLAWSREMAEAQHAVGQASLACINATARMR
jgi:hypothetical protein